MIEKNLSHQLAKLCLLCLFLSALFIWKHGSETELQLRPIEGKLELLAYAPRAEHYSYTKSDLTRWRKALNNRGLASATRCRILSVLYLFAGDINRAAEYLEKAITLNPTDATLWSDLSAVYLRRAENHADSYSVLLALRAAERSIFLDGKLSSSYFNYGLALEKVSLKHQSALAWGKYLTLDSDSGWAREARTHFRETSVVQRELSVLEQYKKMDIMLKSKHRAEAIQAIKISKLHARQFGEEEALPAWGNLWINKNPKADEELSAARELGVLLKIYYKDCMLFDAVESIGHPVQGSIHSINQSRGLRAYRRGLTLYKNYKIFEAHLEFVQASKLLHRAGNPLANWADFFLAACRYQTYDYADARRALNTLIAKRDINRYPYLIARCLWLRGLVSFVAADYEKSLIDYDQARGIFEKEEEFENVIAIDHLTFEVNYLLGNKERAWNSLCQALAGADKIADERRRQAIMEGAAIAALDEGEPALAVHFQNEAVVSAVNSKAAAAIAATLAWRGLMKKRAGLGLAGEVDMVQAKKYAESISDGLVRTGVLGDVLLLQGEILRERQPLRAVVSLVAAAEIFKKTRYHPGLLRTYLELAKAARALKDTTQSETYLYLGLQEVEHQGSQIGVESKSSFFDDARELLDQMVSFQIDIRSRPDQALYNYEKIKARLLMDGLAVKGGGIKKLPHDLRNGLRGLATGTVVVEFSVLETRLLIWLVSQHELICVQRNISSGKLSGLIREARLAIAANQSDLSRRHLSKLYETLLDGVLDKVPEGSTIVFVPDKSLWEFPLSALIDPATGKFIIERFKLELAPSLQFYLSTIARSESVDYCRKAKGLLSIGDPEVDMTLFPQFPRIPFSGMEAVTISQKFSRSVALTGKSATAKKFLYKANQFRFLHIGAHSFANKKLPELSYLVLSRDGEDVGIIYLRDIARMKLSCASLVFLAACDTADGKVSASEGTISIAHAFLLAGAQNVIAALWKVEDQSSAEFSRLFYDVLREGRDPVDALRETKIKMLTHNTSGFRRPSSWASFDLIGSGKSCN